METHIYAVRNGQKLRLDAFHPNGDAKAAVIVLHGGGWRVGSKDWMADVARALAGHGLLALSTQYRLLAEAPWPAQIADVKSAIRWVRRNAGRLSIAPDKIAGISLCWRPAPQEKRHSMLKVTRAMRRLVQRLRFFHRSSFGLAPRRLASPTQLVCSVRARTQPPRDSQARFITSARSFRRPAYYTAPAITLSRTAQANECLMR